MADTRNRRAPVFALTLAAVTVFRAWLAGRVPLTADEAYFWQWSRHLAWCYHDQPPMIAWLTALAAGAPGSPETAVRLTGPLFAAGAAWLVFLLGRDAANRPGVGRAAGLMVLAAPVFAVAGLMATVETLLLFAWALLCLSLYRALVQGRARWWYAAGAAFGFGLLSKYLVLLALPCLGLFLLLSPEHRRRLKRPEPWHALGLSLLMFSPVIAWNARHDWVNFSLNFLRRRDFFPGAAFFSRAFLTFPHLWEYLGGQALALSPLLFGFLLWAMVAAGRRGAAGRDSRLLFLACFSAPVFLFFLAASTLDRVSPHWAGTAYPAACVALALLRAENAGGRAGRWFYRAGWLLLLAVAGVIHLLPLFPGPLIRMEQARREPEAGKVTTFYAGWPAVLGREIIETRRQLGPEGETFILCRGFSLAAYLAFYAPGQPETLAVFQQSAQGQDHLFWQNLDRRIGQNAVYVSEAHDNPAWFEKIRAAFRSVEPAPPLEIRSEGQLVKRFAIWRCYGFRGLPEGTPAWAIERGRKR